MKYIIVLGDGMADYPIEALDGKTPLEVAKTPEMDRLSKLSEIGLVHTVPDGMKPGSDTANLSVLGYNPRIYYSGRSPLEALSIGVDMKDTDVALRCNLVTVSDDDLPYEKKTIIDHSSGEITTEEAAELMKAVRDAFEDDKFKFYLGVSYRHLLIWDRGDVIDLAQPHDHLGEVIGAYLPEQPRLRKMMEQSYDILNSHPINQKRRERGLNPANSLWFWGAGKKPALTSFSEKTGKKGAMISAVDLLRGIAVGSGLKKVIVPGADGTLHTNYEGKANAAADVLLNEDYDFAYIHVEAPDEMGHQGSIERKIQAIENLDQRVISVVLRRMEEAAEDYRMLILPDHPTPIALRTHTSDPVPYLLYDSTDECSETWNYNEREAKASGNYVDEGYQIIEKLFER
ncbi:MAG: cofactor-independent phosphoglycerate mutase [Lachnospiraceae bacterium]|nr:cofactor-independent phosphoglycerate mutase [Lachnospiraceae bacterium]